MCVSSQLPLRVLESFRSNFGLVTLLDMLEFSADEYVEISHQFGMLVASMQKRKLYPDDIRRALLKLLDEVNRLGLLVTRDVIAGLSKKSHSKIKIKLESWARVKIGR